MRRLITFVLVLLGYSSAGAQVWPALPDAGFISGRPATERDVTDGNAIFVAKSHESYIGVPLKIVIPQYAYHIGEGGKKIRVIIVQAEEANGIKLVGYRDFGGKEYAATAAEMQFLGTNPPN